MDVSETKKLPSTLTLRCHAKVNLALSIGTPNPDGLHPLASWMIAVDFSDDLSLTKRDRGPSRYDIRFVEDSPPVRNERVDWPLESDLVYRAHRLLETRLDTELPIELSLRKHIPTGSGLGDGSGDAAGTLVGLNELFGLNLDGATLSGLGGQLGSDVGFLVGVMLGETSCLVTGLGERVTPLPIRSSIELVLIFPGFACPTGKVYAGFDRLYRDSPHRAPEVDRVRGLAGHDPLNPRDLFNDLAEPGFIVQPPLREIRDRIQGHVQLPVHVTGSGSTLFIVTPLNIGSRELGDRITAFAGVPTVATRVVTGSDSLA